MLTGTPCSGPSTSPRATAASARSAASRALSDRSTVTAFSLVLTAAIRPRHDSSASRAEMSRRRIPAATRLALQRQISSLIAIGTLRCVQPSDVCAAQRFRLLSPGAFRPARKAGKSMSVIAVGGFQHETNTFAPSKADFAAFEDGGGWPEFTVGESIAPRLSGANIPAAGAIDTLHGLGHRTVGLVWGAATPSAQVTRDAYERIVGDMLARLEAAGPVDGIYLDLHGAMVTDHFDDGEGELLSRMRRLVGSRVPIVASLDLHANVTQAMIKHCDAFVSYRTYPHVDMAASGERAARLLEGMLGGGDAPAKSFRTLDFLTGLPSQCTLIEPARSLYAMLERLEREHGAVLSFTPGFPMASPTRRENSRWSYSRPKPPSRAQCSAASRALPSCLPIRRTIPAPEATAIPPGCSRRCSPGARRARCLAC